MQQTTFYKPVIFTLTALYLVGCFSPLRLEFDSVRYFAIKDCLESGCDSKDFLPYGYPVFLAALSAVGLLNSFTIAFINGIYLLISLILIRKVMRPASPFLFYTTVLLNWTIIKLFAYPLSEMQYLFFSASSIYCFYQFTKTKNGWLLLMSFLLAVLAVFTRTIGIALIAAIVFGLVWEYRKLFRKKIYLISGLAAAAIIILIIVFAWAKIPGINHYLGTLFYWYDGKAAFFLEHTGEWGQLLLNMPGGKLKNNLPGGWGYLIFLVAGLALTGWLLFALLRRSTAIPAVIIIYLVIYSLVTLNWSHVDPRFWVPLLPFMAGIILQAPLLKGNWMKAVFIAYSLMGIVAFGFSFYTQFNKKAFARTQASGIYRHEYEAYFFNKPLPASANPKVLKLLEEYD
jgi:hypothetical protein